MIQQIHPIELAQKIQSGEKVYLLDVRQPWENEICALPNSVLIPLGELPSRIEEVTPPEGSVVVVYCHHGVRSLSGAAILSQYGIKDVASLWGGIEAWSQLVDSQMPHY